jgi:hypothetical protein
MAKYIDNLDPETRHVTHGAATDVVIGARLNSDTVNRLNVKASGQLEWGGGSGAVDWTFKRNASTSVGYLADSTEVLRITSTASSGDCTMLVVRNIGGTSTLVQVSVGGYDSGGTGYRYLRVPNGP